jgi:hypothetical protein
MRDDHIFIMGPPRSGTLMLTRALGACPDTYLITEHKQKSVIPEERNPRADREFWQETFGLDLPLEEIAFDVEKFERLNGLWLANAGGDRLIVKNPNNVVRAREIRRAFPNASFIWLLRNPWSVIQSMLGGKEAGWKTPMFLGAGELLKHADPALRAAASWVYAIDMMRELKTSADIETRYEDLVREPERELKRIAGHLGLQLTDKAVAIPEWREEEFSVARYLLHRSPERERILALIAPVASGLGYPTRPPGSWAADQTLALRYLARWLQRPRKTPPYGYPRLQKVRSTVEGAARRLIKHR